MPSKNQDAKTIASKQEHEMDYLTRTWKDTNGKSIKLSVLKDIVKKVGRSRRRVNSVLTYLGYKFTPVKKKAGIRK